MPLRGGGVGPLMANAILNFHFDFLTPSLICVTNICFFVVAICLYQEACDPEACAAACYILNQNTLIFLFEFYKLPFLQTEENVSGIKIGLWGCFGV